MDALKSVQQPAPRTPEQELRSPQWYPASPLPKLDPPPLSLGHSYNPSTGSDVRNQLDVLLNGVPSERKPYETHPVQQQVQPPLSKHQHLEHLELLPEDRVFAKLKSWTGEEIAMFPCVAEFVRRKSGVCGHNFTHQPRMESAPLTSEVHSAHWRENHEARKHGLYGSGNYGDYGKQDYGKHSGYHPYHTVRSR
jgi:hypothetical protein